MKGCVNMELYIYICLAVAVEFVVLMQINCDNYVINIIFLKIKL
jgi:hypothetical protein